MPDSGPSAQNARHQHGQGDRRLCVAPVDVSQKCKVPLYPTPTLMSHWGLFELIRELWEEICCESLPAPELKHCRAEHPPKKMPYAPAPATWGVTVPLAQLLCAMPNQALAKPRADSWGRPTFHCARHFEEQWVLVVRVFFFSASFEVALQREQAAHRAGVAVGGVS